MLCESEKLLIHSFFPSISMIRRRLVEQPSASTTSILISELNPVTASTGFAPNCSRRSCVAARATSHTCSHFADRKSERRLSSGAYRNQASELSQSSRAGLNTSLRSYSTNALSIGVKSIRMVMSEYLSPPIRLFKAYDL